MTEATLVTGRAVAALRVEEANFTLEIVREFAPQSFAALSRFEKVTYRRRLWCVIGFLLLPGRRAVQVVREQTTFAERAYTVNTQCWA